MGLKEVKHHIVEEAKQKAKLLLNEAGMEAKHIQQQTAQQLKEYREQQKLHAEQLVAVAGRKELASAEFEGKCQILDRKRAIIESVVQETRKALRNMPAEKRARILRELLQRAQRELDVHLVEVNQDDVSLLHAPSVIVKAGSMNGGLVAENKSGTMSIDFSFDTLLEQAKQQHLKEISEVLF